MMFGAWYESHHPKFFVENYIFKSFHSGSGACNDRFDYEKWVINWRQAQRFNKEWNLQFISSIVTCCTDKTFQIFSILGWRLIKTTFFFWQNCGNNRKCFFRGFNQKNLVISPSFFYSSVFFMANSISMVIIS